MDVSQFAVYKKNVGDCCLFSFWSIFDYWYIEIFNLSSNKNELNDLFSKTILFLNSINNISRHCMTWFRLWFKELKKYRINDSFHMHHLKQCVNCKTRQSEKIFLFFLLKKQITKASTTSGMTIVTTILKHLNDHIHISKE